MVARVSTGNIRARSRGQADPSRSGQGPKPLSAAFGLGRRAISGFTRDGGEASATRRCLVVRGTRNRLDRDPRAGFQKRRESQRRGAGSVQGTAGSIYRGLPRDRKSVV